MGLKRSGFLRRTRLKSRGHRSTLWDAFAEQERRKARDAEGLIDCQDWTIGLPPCYRRVASPDLHHTEGRDGELLLDRSKMVWLVRTPCHDYAHNPAHIPSTEAKNDSARQVGEAASGLAILPVQRRITDVDAWPTRSQVRYYIQNAHAKLVEREKEGTI